MFVQTRVMSNFTSLTQLVSNVTEAFTVTVFLPDRSKKNLYLRSYYSLGNSVIENAVIPLGHGLIGWVAENNLPVNVAPFKQDSKTLQFYSVSEDIQSFLAVPFEWGDSTGVLCIDSKKYYSFTSHHQKILTGFADQFSRLLKSKNDIETDQRDLEIDSLHSICEKIYFEKRKINILDALSRIPLDLVRYDGCAVSILSDDNKKFFVLRHFGFGDHDLNFLKVDKNTSLVGLVLKKNRILNYPHIKKEMRKTFIFQSEEPSFPVKSFLGVPLKSGNHVIGTWSFIGRHSSQFSSKHIKIVSIISYLAASALAKPKDSLQF